MKTRIFFWRLMTRKLELVAESQHHHPNWGLAFSPVQFTSTRVSKALEGRGVLSPHPGKELFPWDHGRAGGARESLPNSSSAHLGLEPRFRGVRGG